MTIHATLYECAHATAPTQRDTFDTWDEFCEALTDLVNVEAPTKAECPYWGPYELAGETRADANVPALSCLVIDIDALPGADVEYALRRLSNEAFAYESPSSTNDTPRIRIVCPTTRHITRAEAAHTRLALAEALDLAPGSGVDGALPASLGFYAGRVKGTPARRTWRIAGPPVDVDALVAAPLMHKWGKRTESKNSFTSVPHKESTLSVTPSHTDRVLELAARIEDRWLAGDRELDNFEKAFYGWLRGAGWSRAEVAGLVEALDQREPDAAKRREHAKKARAATPLAGPSDAVRAWFGDDWTWVDAHATKARREWWERREARRTGTPTETLDHALGVRVALSSPLVEVRYMAESLGIAWAGKVAAIHGYAGTSKGFLLSLVALHVAAGRDLFAKPVARVPVLYLDAETEPMASNRMKRLARGMGIDLAELERDGWITFVDMRGMLAGATHAIAAELATIDRGDGALVCLDSYSSTVDGEEKNSEYADPLWELGRAVRGVNAVALVVMHERKALANAVANARASALEGISGTNRLAAALVTSIRMTRDDESNECRLLVTSTRAPGKRFAPFYLTWTDREDGAIVASVEAASLTSGKAVSKEDHERLVESFVTRIERELRDTYDKDPGATITATALRDLCGGGGRNGVAYAEAVSRCQYRRKSIAREPGRGTQMLYRATPSVAVNVGGKFERRVVTPSKMSAKERGALDATVARLAPKVK